MSYGDTPVLTNVTADKEGGFKVSFKIPPSPSGLHQITVSEPLTTNATSPGEGLGSLLLRLSAAHLAMLVWNWT